MCSHLQEINEQMFFFKLTPRIIKLNMYYNKNPKRSVHSFSFEEHSFQGLVLVVGSHSRPLMSGRVLLSLGGRCPSSSSSSRHSTGTEPDGGGTHFQSFRPKMLASCISFFSLGWKPGAGSHVGHHCSGSRKSPGKRGRDELQTERIPPAHIS